MTMTYGTVHYWVLGHTVSFLWLIEVVFDVHLNLIRTSDVKVK